MKTRTTFEAILAALPPPAYPAGAVYTDGAGQLVTPDAAAFIVVDPIGETTVVGWGHLKPTTARFQLTAFAKTQTGALALLESARAALPLPEYQPDRLRRVGKLGQYHVYAQDYLV